MQAGKTLVIGLHPWSEKYPQPGTKGSVQIGLVVSRDEPIEELAARLRKHGVMVSDIVESEEANYIFFADPDGNPIYVGDWNPDLDERASQRTPWVRQCHNPRPWQASLTNNLRQPDVRTDAHCDCL